MRYTTLGASGLTVSRIVLGAAQFGLSVDEAGARKLVRAALDVGVTTFDTADAYAGGASEPVLGAALPSGMRDQLVLCTKVGLRVGDDDAAHAAGSRPGGHDLEARWHEGIAPTDEGLSRKHLVTAVEDSLRRLRTDYVDLYQVHRFDTRTPLLETLQAMDDLVRAGKVRYVGCSGFAAWQMCVALGVSERERLPRFVSHQVRYSVVDRAAEHEVLPACEAVSVGALAFQVMAGGVLTARVTPGEGEAPDPESRASRDSVRNRYWKPEVGVRARALQGVAEQYGRSVGEIAVAWAMGARAVAAVIAGASRPEQLRDAARAADMPLSSEERAAVDAAAQL